MSKKFDYKFNLIPIVEDYIERMISEVSGIYKHLFKKKLGMKCLLLDDETIGITSLIMS